MRLVTLTLIVLLGLLILIILFPVLFLNATASTIPEPYYQQAGEVLAGMSMITGRPAAAVEVYDMIISLHPELADLYLKKSDSLLAIGDIPAAIISLDDAIIRDPKNPVILIKKARLLISIGEINESDLILQHIIGIQTNNPEYLSNIADITLERALYPEALEKYTQLLTLQPNDGLTWEKRSDVIFALLTIPTAGFGATSALKARDLYSEGIQGYERAMGLSPDRIDIIRAKIEKRSEEYTPATIDELQARYQQYRYLQPGENPLPFP
jgi:tetratricopeptide (TPR) repeat protein